MTRCNTTLCVWFSVSVCGWYFREDSSLGYDPSLNPFGDDEDEEAGVEDKEKKEEQEEEEEEFHDAQPQASSPDDANTSKNSTTTSETSAIQSSSSLVPEAGTPNKRSPSASPKASTKVPPPKPPPPKPPRVPEMSKKKKRKAPEHPESQENSNPDEYYSFLITFFSNSNNGVPFVFHKPH